VRQGICNRRLFSLPVPEVVWLSFVRLAVGRRGEELAVKYLMNKGYEILARNYRCKIGELDVVARHAQALIFVEVRSSSSLAFGWPHESVNKKKRAKLRLVAQYYIQSTCFKLPVRFDVIGISFGTDGKLRNIEHVEDAF